MAKSITQIRQEIRNLYDSTLDYAMTHHSDFDFTLLKYIPYKKKGGKGRNNSYNDCIIMFDTETSKLEKNQTREEGVVDKRTGIRYTKTVYEPVQNYIVAWSLCIYALDRPIVTLWGHTPESLTETIQKIVDNMRGEETFIYAHNLPYDYVFGRKYFFKQWGTPERQLNIKPHYPIYLTFEHKDHFITFKDSLVLAQRKLEKWADDLEVEHRKAVGKWEYNKIRTQAEKYTPDELLYIENDVLAGCECLHKTMQTLNKSIYSLPYTATGIPREEAQKLAKKNCYKSRFLSMALTYDQYKRMEKVYHGGYTHANRHYISRNVCDIFESYIEAYDFASSYPFCMLACKFPMERFEPIEADVDFIIRNSNNYAFTFLLYLEQPRLKNDFEPMPALQYSKCVEDVNAIVDNGRILCCDHGGFIKIWLNELDLKVILEQYDYDRLEIFHVEVSKKGYLPKWFTDYAFQLYIDKCKLKDGGDPVLYNLQKAKLNSLYGMLVQKSIKETILEDYITGDMNYDTDFDHEEEYEKYINKRTSYFPYQWGCWVTSHAFEHLFELGKCCKEWIYSDTDSCFGIGWDTEKLNAYNEKCKEMLRANGYGAVVHNNKEYWLGVAEFDGSYSEFVTCGAKRYCCRYSDDPRNKEKNRGKLKITVAGVPKCGVSELDDDINNFKRGFNFKGVNTGKLSHSYLFNNDIQYINGLSIGDSIDLNPADYTLDDVERIDWESLFYDDVEVQIYE